MKPRRVVSWIGRIVGWVAASCLGASSLVLGQDRPPVITRQPHSQIVVVGGEARFAVHLEPNPLTPRFEWYRAPDILVDDTSDTLVLSGVTGDVAELYRVIVSNSAGSTSSDEVGLTVLEDTSIPGSLGATVALGMQSYGPEQVSRQWRLNGRDLPGATGVAHVILNAQPTDVGQYSVRVTTADNSFELPMPPNVVDPTFTKITAGPLVIDQDGSISSTWMDYDGDGFLDVHVANSILSTNETTIADCLYRNDGNGGFTKVPSALFPTLPTNSSTGAVGDYDNDGLPDLYAAHWDRPNALHHNVGGTRFELQASPVTEHDCHSGFPSWSDYDRNGFIDLFVPVGLRGCEGADLLWHNDGDGSFTAQGLDEVGDLFRDRSAGYDAVWADYDNDGWPDLWVGAAPRMQLYHNEGNGTFTRPFVPSLDWTSMGEAAWGDYDNDGNLDLFIACGDGKPEQNLLYRNNGNSNGWIQFRLVGTVSNRSAIGAKVRVRATIGGRTFWQLRELSSGGFAPTTPGLIAHFGLGNAAKADVVRIEWPSGTVTELDNVAAKQMLTVTEPPRLLAAGAGSFQIQCWKGQSFEVQSSPDLAVWTPRGTVTNESGTLLYTDPDPDPHQCRFYRVQTK